MKRETVSAENIRGLFGGKLEFNGSKILVENGAPLRDQPFIVVNRTADNLPITTIKMAERKPCNDPNEEQIPSSKDKIFGPELRRQNANGCK